MQPHDTYLKSKRNLLILSSILLISVLVGIEQKDGGGVSLIPAHLRDSTYLNLILALGVGYYLIQISLFWNAQNSDIKDLIHYKLDFYLSFIIGGLSVSIFIVRSISTHVALNISLDNIEEIISTTAILALFATILSTIPLLSRQIIQINRRKRVEIEEIATRQMENGF